MATAPVSNPPVQAPLSAKPSFFVDPKIALKNPFRRIYLFWGLVMLFGFPIIVFFPRVNLFYYWVPLTILGIIGQLALQPIKVTNRKAIFLHVMWVLVAAGGVLINYLAIYTTFPVLYYPQHYGAWWLLVLGIPQIITGYLVPLHKKVQIVTGVVWLFASILMETFFAPFDFSVGFILVALLTGLPYLYIATKK